MQISERLDEKKKMQFGSSPLNLIQMKDQCAGKIILNQIYNFIGSLFDLNDKLIK